MTDSQSQILDFLELKTNSSKHLMLRKGQNLKGPFFWPIQVLWRVWTQLPQVAVAAEFRYLRWSGCDKMIMGDCSCDNLITPTKEFQEHVLRCLSTISYLLSEIERFWEIVTKWSWPTSAVMTYIALKLNSKNKICHDFFV